MEAKENAGSYAISSTLGIRNVTIQFHVEVLKFFNLNIVDFKANGSLEEIDIPLLALLSPTQKWIKFDRISIQNLDQLEIDIRYENFLTFLGGSIPAVDRYIKNQIKSSIAEAIESRIGQAKSYLNNLLSSFIPSKAAVECLSAEDQNATTPANMTRVPPKEPPFILTIGEHVRGLPKAFEIIIQYKGRVVGFIPVPGDGMISGMFFGYYNSEKRSLSSTIMGNSFVMLALMRPNQHGLSPLREKPTFFTSMPKTTLITKKSN